MGEPVKWAKNNPEWENQIMKKFYGIRLTKIFSFIYFFIRRMRWWRESGRGWWESRKPDKTDSPYTEKPTRSDEETFLSRSNAFLGFVSSKCDAEKSGQSERLAQLRPEITQIQDASTDKNQVQSPISTERQRDRDGDWETAREPDRQSERENVGLSNISLGRGWGVEERIAE